MVFTGIVGLTMAIYAMYERITERKKLISRVSGRLRPVRHNILAGLYSVLCVVGDNIKPASKGKISAVKKRLITAGFRHPLVPSFYFGLSALTAAIVFVFFLAVCHLAGLSVLFCLPAAVLGYLLPAIMVSLKISRRNTAIFKELPDVLDLIVACVEAGLNFETAFLKVSEEFSDIAPVLAAESAQYFYETKSGVIREEALNNLRERNSEPSLKSVVSVFIQSLKFGTDITESLRVYSRSLKTERMRIAEEKAAKAAVKISIPLIVFILPALLLVMIGPAFINLVTSGVIKVLGK